MSNQLKQFSCGGDIVVGTFWKWVMPRKIRSSDFHAGVIQLLGILEMGDAA